MIELYRAPDDPEADRVEDALRESASAYRAVVCTADEARAALGQNVGLPAVRDGGRVAHGADALRAFLDEHARALEEWRKFQTDACYLDDDGNVC